MTVVFCRTQLQIKSQMINLWYFFLFLHKNVMVCFGTFLETLHSFLYAELTKVSGILHQIQLNLSWGITYGKHKNWLLKTDDPLIHACSHCILVKGTQKVAAKHRWTLNKGDHISCFDSTQCTTNQSFRSECCLLIILRKFSYFPIKKKAMLPPLIRTKMILVRGQNKVVLFYGEFTENIFRGSYTSNQGHGKLYFKASFSF